ncbi:hypothetical protein KJK32_44520 [Streptomyces sp. JCM17656]|nr:hypothetical protein KJK32_44520 [Streptomyces sp. JCM17656]
MSADPGLQTLLMAGGGLGLAGALPLAPVGFAQADENAAACTPADVTEVTRTMTAHLPTGAADFVHLPIEVPHGVDTWDAMLGTAMRSGKDWLPAWPTATRTACRRSSDCDDNRRTCAMEPAAGVPCRRAWAASPQRLLLSGHRRIAIATPSTYVTTLTGDEAAWESLVTAQNGYFSVRTPP